MRGQVDSSGNQLLEPGTELMYRTARNGDHLMGVPFQCEVCHFRNIMRRDPDWALESDTKLLALMRRVNLDVFWSRESGTVSANLSQAREMLVFAEEFRIQSFTSEMGPFPLEDTLGMLAAVAVMRKSLKKGRYEDFVQPATFRKMQTVISNISRAGPKCAQEAVVFTDKHRMAWITSSPTHTLWHARFMQGIKRRVGNVVRQDAPITIEVLMKVLSVLEFRWSHPEDFDPEETATLAVWFAVGFCLALRGEEMLIVEYDGTAASIIDLGEGRHRWPYFVFHINGKTKANRNAGVHFELPCVGLTEGSGIPAGEWMIRLVDLLRDRNKKGGFLFDNRDPSRPTTLSDFAEGFFTVLEEVQATTDLIPKTMDVRDSFSLWRSLRRGATAHARNQEIDPRLINLIHRWEMDKKAEGLPRGEMIEVYSELRHMFPTLLRYSRQL